MSHIADSYQLHEDLKSRWGHNLQEDFPWNDDRRGTTVSSDRVQLPTQSFASFQAPANDYRPPSAAPIATRIASGSADRKPSATDFERDLVQICEENWTSHDEVNFS